MRKNGYFMSIWFVFYYGKKMLVELCHVYIRFTFWY